MSVTNNNYSQYEIKISFSSILIRLHSALPQALLSDWEITLTEVLLIYLLKRFKQYPPQISRFCSIPVVTTKFTHYVFHVSSLPVNDIKSKPCRKTLIHLIQSSCFVLARCSTVHVHALNEAGSRPEWKKHFIADEIN